MLRMGLTVPERKQFEALLASHHHIEVQVSLMDLNHNELSNITTRLIDGQVTFDAGAEVTRSLSLDLSDPAGALHLDSNSPDAGAMFADRMIRVRYAVINPERTKRYNAPVFTGPITQLDRDGANISVEAQGKESLGMAIAWTSKTYKKGYRVTSAIRHILANMIGENRYRIPNLKYKLPRNVSVGGDKVPWKVAKQMAASIGYQLYYDGWGTCRMRRMPRGISFTFRHGPGGAVKSEPNIGFSIDKVINAVEVWGKKPEKPKKGKPKKKRPHARVVAPRSHPLSPWALGRKTGSTVKPRYLPIVVEDDSITTTAEARRRAKAILRNGLLESVDVTFDAIVIPHLEELDIVRLTTPKFSANHRLRKFAIPLTSGGSSPIGYVRNVKPNRSKIRRTRRARRR